MSALKFSSHRKFHLVQSKTAQWLPDISQLEHYRIVFVVSGEGHFLLSDRLHKYAPEGIIFLTPGQQPVFQENKKAEILVITFDTYLADDFQKKKTFAPEFADTYKQAENICNSLKYTQGAPLQNSRDRQTVAYLIGQIVFEIAQQSASHFRLIQGSIDLIITILSRNNFESKKVDDKRVRHTLTESLVQYLRDELHQNKTIRIPEVLMHFNISEELANLCVMNKTGMSLRNFIFKYKADLFKSRMLKIDVLELSTYLRPNAVC